MMLKSTTRVVRGLILLAASTGLLGLALAQAQDDDPPLEAARLSYVNGSISIQQAGTDEWMQAAPNFPLAPGDRVFVDADSFGEIQIGQIYVRLGANTDLSVVSLSPYSIALGVGQGEVHVHEMSMWPNQRLAINTPNGSMVTNHNAEFRVDVYNDQQSAVFSNYQGDVYVVGAGGFSQRLYDGSVLQLAGVNPVYPQWLEMNDPDSLDMWSQQRDQWIAQSLSAQYVNAAMPGIQELDAAGTWMPDSDFGPVWFPNDVPYGWEPYHYGHWMNRQPWGWVWIEDESWGYAPFHYGRWAIVNNRWGWIPGPRDQRPVWSPALVVFAGGIQVGGVGISVWFPLGPGEAYRPWYPCSPRYIDQVNISNIRESRVIHVQTTYVNIVNVTNVTYVNRTVGVTAMRHEDFASGHSAYKVAVHVDPQQIQHAQILARPVPQVSNVPVIFKRPVRPVPVAVARPMLINGSGKQISAVPNAKPIEPPVRTARPPAASIPLPNHKPAVNVPNGQPKNMQSDSWKTQPGTQNGQPRVNVPPPPQQHAPEMIPRPTQPPATVAQPQHPEMQQRVEPIKPATPVRQPPPPPQQQHPAPAPAPEMIHPKPPPPPATKPLAKSPTKPVDNKDKKEPPK